MVTWLLLVVLTFTVYASTAARGITGFGDSDELLTVGHVLGLAHPPGYPVLTVVTHVFMRLLPFSAEINGHLLAALLQALTVGFIYLGAVEVFKTIHKKQTTTHSLYAALGALTLGFSYLFWQYALVLEVFPWQHMLVSGLFFVSFRIQRLKRKIPLRLWLSWFGMLGLLLSHHQLSWLLVPGMGLWLIAIWKLGFSGRWWFWGGAVMGFTVFLSYALLFWLHSLQASLSWQFSPSLSGLVHFVLRKDFGGTFIETGDIQAAFLGGFHLPTNLAALRHYFFSSLPAHWSVALLLIALGGIYIWRHLVSWWRAGLFIMVGVLVVGVAFYLGLPDSSDTSMYLQTVALTERMYLLGYVLLGFLVPFGLAFIGERSQKLAIVVGVLTVGWLFFRTYPQVNLHGYTWVDSVLRQGLTEVKEDSVIVCFSDVSCFGLLELQQVQNMRPDVVIVPVTPEMRDRYLRATNPTLQQLWYPDNPFRVAEVISWNIFLGKPVYVIEIPDFYRNYMGISAGVFLMNRVSQLSEKMVVDRRNSFQASHQYLDLDMYEIVPGMMPDMEGCSDFTCRFNQLYWQTLVNPKDIASRLALAQLLMTADLAPLAKREYHHVLQLDPTNNEAAGFLDQLRGVPELE